MVIRNRSSRHRAQLAAAIVGVLQVAANTRSSAQTLPVPASTWVTSGAAGGVKVGNTFTVNQTTERVILNWQSFNIGADGKVIFNQPGVNSIALNKIFDQNPSEIQGTLQANGQLYLINPNGFLFGATARVNTSGLLASSLNFTDEIFENGLLSAKLAPALSDAGNAATVLVEPGAQLTTNAAGQRILLSAKTVDNRGTITANDGQVVLAAGDAVYVAASDDPRLRGLVVEVNGGGTVTNTGTVISERGNITAVGLAVNQNGRLSATTSVAANGSIRLLARDTAVPTIDEASFQARLEATRGGALTLGAGSVTEVNPDAGDKTTAVNEQEQFASRIELSGKTVELKGGSTVRAAGGDLSVAAASIPNQSRADGVRDPDARIRVNAGAVVDLSGSTATASVTRNLVTVELRANELADSPEQRDGPLRGKTVVVDARVTTANGNQGTDIGNVSGAIALIGQDVLERTASGGTAMFDSAGDIVVANGATIDVSGGAVNYLGGAMRTTQLIRADGSVVDIGQASKTDHFIGLVNPIYKSVSDRWGVVRFIGAPGIDNYEPGYVQGADAGTIQFMGNAMVLGGNFIGTAINGAGQRSLASMAQGGRFIVGVENPNSSLQSFRAPTVNLVTASPAVSVGAESSLPANLALNLSRASILGGGFSRLQFSSDNRVVVAPGATMELTPGGSMSMTAPHIEINASVYAASGSVKATAINTAAASPYNGQAGLFVGDNVAFDVRGLWVNDAIVPLDVQPSGPTLIKGGEITLTQSTVGGALQIGNDVSLHASGGAWLRRSNSISGGAGGAVQIASASGISTGVQTMRFGGNLRIDGFGVQGVQGGTFTLRAPRLEVSSVMPPIGGGDARQIGLPLNALIDGFGMRDAQGVQGALLRTGSLSDSTPAPWLGAQEVNTNALTGGVLRVGTSLFSDFGFSNFSLFADNLPLHADSSAAILRVRNGAEIDLSAQTMLIDSAAISQASTDNIAQLSTANQPLEFQARPANLTLRAVSSLDQPNLYGGLVVESGSRISGNAASAVTLSTNGNLQFGGRIDVDGGAATLNVLATTADDQRYIARQLELTSTARIDVSAGVIRQANDQGLQLGRIQDGGRVSLSANRGSVSLAEGSFVDVSGTQAELDLLIANGGQYTRREVSSAAGTLSIHAEETIAMQADFLAHGGVSGGSSNVGGSLNIDLTRSLPSGAFASTFPVGPRVVELVKEGNAKPANGIASIDTDLLIESGIENLQIRADDRVSIGDGVDLRLDRSIVMNAPAVAMSGGSGSASLGADYIALGPQQAPKNAVTASAGSASLTLRADQIDLVGSIVTQGIKRTTLDSAGDITLQGYPQTTNAPASMFTTPGDVTLKAQRVLPTTRSSYTIAATDANGTVRIDQAAADGRGVPMSVGGSLTINAANIVQGGTLVAPFGAVNLNAGKTLQLGNGSVTSVSGAGAVLPFGRVDNGTTWVWGQDPTNPDAVAQIPERRIRLNAPAVDMATGAVVDVSGGGDLLAYQYTPGTGGKQDVLDPTSSGYLKDTYVIVPGSKGQAVAYDPLLWRGSNLTPGQSIYIAAGSEVPEGTYTLLPARYALASGAYLVTSVNGYQDIASGSVATTADGAAIVAGYYTFGNERSTAVRNSGFAIRPGSYARRLAQYDDHLASAFFPAHAADEDKRIPLPADAGKLTIAVDGTLNASATVKGRGFDAGKNAAMEISAANIEVVASNAVGASPAGTVRLASSTLSGWNAGSLLLGGTRKDDEINVRSDTVVVRGGASLSADEVVMVAGRRIDVETGGAVSSTSANQPSLALDAKKFAESTAVTFTGNQAASAALLAVSDLSYLKPERSSLPSTAGATITVASNARVATRGAVAVDGSGAISLAPNSIRADGASWSLGSTHVAFGDAGAATDGLAIDGSLQANLQTARAINLSSAQSLDITQGVSLGNAETESLVLKTAAVRNLAGSAASTFTAKNVELSGVNAQAAPTTAGTGSLSFNAQAIEIGSGELAVSGFASTSLNAAGLVTGSGTGGLTTAGDLKVVSAAVTTLSGANTTLSANNGTVSLSAASAAAPAANTLPTGGTLSISGKDIVDSGRIVMPSGVVSLTASNALTLQGNAVIDTAGYRPTLADSGSNGGAINLASAGALTVGSGAALTVAAGSRADAGSIDMFAGGSANIAGALSGKADTGFEGGEFEVHAGSLTDFGALNRAVELGGFTERRSYRVGSGDLTLAAGDGISSQHIELTADAGSVIVDGRLIAASDDQRGAIIVNARNNVVVGGAAVLDVSAVNGAQQRGGSIELGTTSGVIQIASTAGIRASGQNQSGRLTLRAPATATDFNAVSLPTDLTRIDTLVLEPIKSYSLSAVPTATEIDGIGANINSYLNVARNNILNRFGLQTAKNVFVRPYADMTRAGDLAISDFDFASGANAWRFGGQPAVVSMRATGNLNVSGVLNDGFEIVANTLGDGLDLLGSPSSPAYSSGFNLVAGADLTSSSMHATRRSSSADLSLSGGAIVRTGTGDISLAAARDIVFESGSSVYTGGLPGAPTLNDDDGVNIYPDKGGSIELLAGRDLVGSDSQQQIGDWQLFWANLNPDGETESIAYWGVDAGRFGWNVGAFGGGDVRISAARDVSKLTAAVTDSVAQGAAVDSRVEVGGGDLSMTGGRDINAANVYVSKGTGTLRAWGSFGGSDRSSGAGPRIGVRLYSGESIFRLASVGDVLFSGEDQVSMLSPTRFSQMYDTKSSFVYFTRYGNSSALTARSSGGVVDFAPGFISLYPDTVNLAAFGTDVVINGPLNLAPSADGNLSVYAARDIIAKKNIVGMSDVAAANLLGSSSTNVAIDEKFGLNFNDPFADVLHLNDSIASKIGAGRDIKEITLQLAEASEVRAGRDILDLTFDVQHGLAATTSVLTAGRDFSFSAGAITTEIRVGGIGLLEVLAGRNVDLGFSRGISTAGDLLNGNLPSADGADVVVMGGVKAIPDAGPFLDGLLPVRDDLRDELVDFVERETGLKNLGFDASLAAYRALPSARQIPLAVKILFAELVSSGREANEDPGQGFARGYSALANLFPGSQGAKNPYSGDLSLPFSRIYTLDGGSIALLTPGGKIDVGLANPPNLARLNLDRKPSELGIVAQQAGDVFAMADGDVLVNTSRIFTLGGGDIAIWSSRGNIDAGKGAKSAISAPAPTLTVDSAGNVSINVGSAVAGSGIRTILTDKNVKPGNVDLIAPAGFVNAGDAGIGSSGNLNIAAQRVVGLDNIQVGGTSTGVPPETGGLGAALSGVTAAAGNSTTAAANTIGDSSDTDKGPAALADAAMSWLEVFVVGLGEETCKQDDIDCLKRQPGK